MDFIDRLSELERLNTLATRPDGGLAVLWGRRRVGKTRLLLEWSAACGGLYTVADPSAASIQRAYFARAVSVRFPGFHDVDYPDWPSLLRRLASECRASSWRGPIILDELPYLILADSVLPGILQNWIDHEARAAGLIVALAGSSQRMMQGAVLDESAPLFGRAGELIDLQPLSPAYLHEAFGAVAPRLKVELYAVWGGIPRYWELACPYGANLERSVDVLVLDPGGPLHREPDRLLLEESPPAVSLRPLLDAIGLGANRVSEIAGRLGQPATSLARPLSRLAQLGIVRRELPYGESEKSSRLALYRIADPFFRFWFSTVAPHRALLAEVPAESRLTLWRSRRDRLESEIWEDLCRAAVPYLHRTDGPLAAQGPWGPARRFWRGTGPEWDVVASSLDGRRLLLGEARWLSAPCDSATLQGIAHDLLRKGMPPFAPVPRQEITYAVFVPEVLPGARPPDMVQAVEAGQVLDCRR